MLLCTGNITSKRKREQTKDTGLRRLGTLRGSNSPSASATAKVLAKYNMEPEAFGQVREMDVKRADKRVEEIYDKGPHRLYIYIPLGPSTLSTPDVSPMKLRCMKSQDG
ncbi:hypothetical protein QAD02_015175 [Eretmocerus hayati]|uniref:Uncharacterized protein n=1 Tax=Eretmocerus hayati TaxID=131215 RepID=A0ACC2P7J2_9HYME|nr:hypothetical protein QAD02_015175 [Eretmocerus hayati]